MVKSRLGFRFFSLPSAAKHFGSNATCIRDVPPDKTVTAVHRRRVKRRHSGCFFASTNSPLAALAFFSFRWKLRFRNPDPPLKSELTRPSAAHSGPIRRNFLLPRQSWCSHTFRDDAFSRTTCFYVPTSSSEPPAPPAPPVRRAPPPARSSFYLMAD